MRREAVLSGCRSHSELVNFEQLTAIIHCYRILQDFHIVSAIITMALIKSALYKVDIDYIL